MLTRTMKGSALIVQESLAKPRRYTICPWKDENPYGGDRVIFHGRVILEDGPQRLFAGEGEQGGLGGYFTDPLVPFFWPESCKRVHMGQMTTLAGKHRSGVDVNF